MDDGEEKLGKIKHLIEARSSDEVIADASIDFYQVIRHNFGENAQVIDSIEMVQRKLEVIECLRNYTPAFDLTNETSIIPLSQATNEYKLIKRYFANGSMLREAFDVDLERVFVVNSNGDKERYEPLFNRQMLWHGTPFKNIINILSKGLLVDPPQYPNSRAMFGKGIYFADVVAKSAEFCQATEKIPKGVVLLCDVSLGNIKDEKRGNKQVVLEEGFHSVRALGRKHPLCDKTVDFKENVKIPLGEVIKNKDRSQKDHFQPWNVYAIKNDKQVKIDYLLQINFRFKKNTEGGVNQPRSNHKLLYH